MTWASRIVSATTHDPGSRRWSCTRGGTRAEAVAYARRLLVTNYAVTDWHDDDQVWAAHDWLVEAGDADGAYEVLSAASFHKRHLGSFIQPRGRICDFCRAGEPQGPPGAG